MAEPGAARRPTEVSAAALLYGPLGALMLALAAKSLGDDRSVAWALFVAASGPCQGVIARGLWRPETVGHTTALVVQSVSAGGSRLARHGAGDAGWCAGRAPALLTGRDRLPEHTAREEGTLRPIAGPGISPLSVRTAASVGRAKHRAKAAGMTSLAGIRSFDLRCRYYLERRP